MFVYRLVTDRTELGHICIVCTHHVGLNGEHISSFQIVHWILKVVWDIRPHTVILVLVGTRFSMNFPLKLYGDLV